MTLSLKLLRGTTLAQRPLGGLLRTPTSQWRRAYSTAPAADGTLPLQGIRVLDMTRVLAGVGFLSLSTGMFTDQCDVHSRIVPKSWAI